MEFTGYTNKTMIDLTDKIYSYKENYVFNDDEHIKLAIKLPDNYYSLYIWDEYSNLDTEDVDSIIESKSKETIRLFQETIGLYNTRFPTSIYKEVNTIIRINGIPEVLSGNNYTETVKEECGVSLMHDFLNNSWLVRIGKIVNYPLNNEKSARKVFDLIVKDISNYICYKWKRV